MFKFDQVALPKLLIRKALVIVDFQQDFVGENAAMPITLPDGYADRTVRLAKAFRRIGDVVWVNTRFEEVRPPYDEHMEDLAPGHSAGYDAFLSYEKAQCMLSSKIGAEVPQTVKDDAKKTDIFFLKSHYSAFEGTGLLRLLRARMTMEVYVCGSLINAGVYATTVDAAGHGFVITLVEDCCGYSTEGRQIKAIKRLQILTGCDLSMSAEIVQENTPSPPAFQLDRRSCMHESGGDSIAESMGALTLDTTLAPRAAEAGAMQGNPGEAVATCKPVLDSTLADILPGDTSNSIIQNCTASMNASEPSKTDAQQNHPKLHSLCEGDTDVIENLLPPELEAGIFETLSQEVQWQRMSHQGGEVPRLIAVQGEVGSDGSVPIYRHPSDESPRLLPFSPTVLAIKAVTEEQLGHSLNHVLIQFYRDGKDYISEHSDKTLDIVRDSFIANVSLGAKRTMVLRTKRADKDHSSDEQHVSNSGRKVQRAPLPHNSLCRMGLRTNMKWLHSIRQDKRADRDKSPDELAYEGGRISLTFRQIGTFLDKNETKIWGQGATAKTPADAKNILNGQKEESIKMLRAFGTENHSSNFDWDAYYGIGFDVLHLRSTPRFFSSTDAIINMRISMMLAEYDIGYASGSITQSKKSATSAGSKQSTSGDVFIKYVDNDDSKTEVTGDLAIMLYLHANHQKKKSAMALGELANQFTLFQKSLSLLTTWRELMRSIDSDQSLLIVLRGELQQWELCTPGTDFIGGGRPGLADFALWPVLHSMIEMCGCEVLAEFKALGSYYTALRMRPSTVKMLDRLQQT